MTETSACGKNTQKIFKNSGPISQSNLVQIILG
jgi:hypothetical protein